MSKSLNKFPILKLNMNKDLVRIIKGFEREFLQANLELFKHNKVEYIKQREEFIGKKLEEMKTHEE